jgi:hypothetical protein
MDVECTYEASSGNSWTKHCDSHAARWKCEV